jgi:hypothetical protein
MSRFFTEVDIPRPEYTIDYHSKLLFLGSCFVENIGEKMKKLKFDTCLNPFGVLFNPQSIANSLKILLEKDSYQESDLSFYNDLYFSYAHYTLFSDTDAKKCLEKINESFSSARNYILKADVLFITLGTSWVYTLKNTGQVVANCHKLPASNFDRVFSSFENSASHLKDSIDSLRKLNSKVKIVFTVSPIRHFKDGAIENQRSKASLHLAVAQLQEEFPDIFYFPAYEIFMDELRDYRFYAEDMVHPSTIANDYIWDRYMNTFLDEKTRYLASEIQKLIAGIDHRPRHSNTNAYKSFVKSLSQKLDALLQQNPTLDFTQERDTLEKIFS